MKDDVVVLDAFALVAFSAVRDLARAAADFKRLGGISYADCFAAALALRRKRSAGCRIGKGLIAWAA